VRRHVTHKRGELPAWKRLQEFFGGTKLGSKVTRFLIAVGIFDGAVGESAQYVRQFDLLGSLVGENQSNSL
jgi:hypothetical protein